jgi:hypothetical protein
MIDGIRIKFAISDEEALYIKQVTDEKLADPVIRGTVHAHQDDRIYLEGAYRGQVNGAIQSTYNGLARYDELADPKYTDTGGIFDIMAIITSLFEYHHQTLNDTMATLASLDTSITNNFTCFYSAVEYSQVIEQGAFRHGILRFRMRVRLNDQ